jgi:hypothetical protein
MIYLLKKKSDAYSAFANFQKLVERKLDTKILTVQSDWGGEYFFNPMEFLTMFFVPMPIKKMIMLKESIVISWKLV